MFRLRIRGKMWRPRSPLLPKPGSFLISGLLHALLIIGLPRLEIEINRDDPSLARYKVIPIPKNPDKILWYYPDQKLPEIADSRSQDRKAEPRGREQSKDTLVSIPVQRQPGNQLIWQPKPAPVVAPEIAAPNLVVIQPPVPPAPPKPTPRVLVPPREQRAGTPAELTLEALPQVAIADSLRDQARLSVAAVQLPKAKLKTFVPPPVSPSTGKPTGNVFSEAPPPSGSGNSNVSLAIVGLQPAPQLGVALPAGSRTAEFARAPTVGPPSTGGGSGSASLEIPGLRVKEGTTPPPVPAVRAPRGNATIELTMPPAAVTSAAPLRPSARSIPRSIEARFTQRTVYTLVVQRPILPMYSGDWTIWFAEKQERLGETVQMRPPVPVRKHFSQELNGAGDKGQPIDSYLQIAATVQQDGKLANCVLAGRDPAGLAKAAIEDLMQWEFRPAAKNGQPAEVEVVFEIPYRLSRPSGEPN